MCLPIEIFEIIFDQVDFQTRHNLKLCNKSFNNVILNRQIHNIALNEIRKCASETNAETTLTSLHLFNLDSDGNKYREIYSTLSKNNSREIQVHGIEYNNNNNKVIIYQLPRDLFITSLTFDSTLSKSFVRYEVGGSVYTDENLGNVKSILSGCLPSIPVLIYDKKLLLYCKNEEAKSSKPLLIVKGNSFENLFTNTVFEAPFLQKTENVSREFIEKEVTQIHNINAPLVAIFIRANLSVLTNIKRYELFFDEKIIVSICKPWMLLNSNLCDFLAKEDCGQEVLKCINNIDTSKVLVIPIIGYKSAMCLPDGKRHQNKIRIEFEQMINSVIEIKFEYLTYNIIRQLDGMVEGMAYHNG